MSFSPEELADYFSEGKRTYSSSWEWIALTEAFNAWNMKKNDENLNCLRWRILDFNAACEKTTETKEW